LASGRPEEVAEPTEAAAAGREERSAEIASHGNGESRNKNAAYYRSLDYARWSPLQRLARRSISAFARLVTRVDVDGLQHLPPRGAFLLASNHLSLIDGPLMWPFVPRRTVIFAGERWAHTPLVNWAFDFVDAIYIRRGAGDRAALDTGLAVLQSGGVLGLAPEGRISASGGLGEGRTGLAYLAHEAGVPIVPLVMYGHEHVSANLRRLRRTPVHIRVGPPIVLPAADRTAVRLREDTQYVMSVLAAMLPPAYRGVYNAEVQQT
jgi:1-acyl-sn-glycerol-3-phosphate acyltransferase